jgi:hypothetical protein
VARFGELAGVAGLEPPARVEIVPYAVARLTREPGAADDPFHAPSRGFGSVGADVRVGLGSSLTLSATLNPDFGQVEADPAVLNLSAYETLQEERRPFFVEGSDIFGLAFPSWPPFFYSRRIGRAPQGPSPAGAVYTDRPAASTILGAVKLSGKTASGWSVGALGAVTGAEEMRFVDTEGARGAAAVEPLTRHAVARVVRELRDGRSGVGLLATAVHRRLDDPRLAFLHAGAYALALDGYHRFAGDSHELRVGILGSHVRGDTAAIRRTQTAPGHYYQRPDAGHVELDPTRTSLSGLSLHARLARIAGPWKYGLSGSATSPGYEVTDLGFNPELDRVQTNAWLRYESYEAGRRLRSWNLGSYVMAQTDVAGQVQELTQDVGFNVQLPSYWGGGVWLMRHQPAWSAHHLRGGPSLRKPGRWMGSFDASSDPRRALSGNGFVFWETEDDTDGHRVSVQVSATLRPSERTSLRAGPSLSFAREAWQHVGAREVAGERRWLVGGLDTRTLGLSTRLDYTMSPTLSLQLYARPFVATVEYDTFRELADPDARAFGDRFLTYALTRSARAGPDLLALDRNADGVPDLELVDPSFTSASVQVNVVLRWEYGPGSALYAVWTHDRDTSGEDRYALGPNLDRLWDTPARNVFMLKASWWVGL